VFVRGNSPNDILQFPRPSRVRVALGLRLIPLFFWVITIAAGLLSRAVLSGAPAKYVGVALWASSVYFLVYVIYPRVHPGTAVALTLLASWGVELAQITDIPHRISTAVPILRLVVGETFNPADLVALAVGAVAAWVVGLCLLPRLWLLTAYESWSRSFAAKAACRSSKQDC
jgi:hypothetical protein